MSIHYLNRPVKLPHDTLGVAYILTGEAIHPLGKCCQLIVESGLESLEAIGLLYFLLHNSLCFYKLFCLLAWFNDFLFFAVGMVLML